jgi:hypothetical protein
MSLQADELRGASPDLYVELLESRRILGETIKAQYTFPTDTGEVSGTLIDIPSGCSTC